MSETVEREQVRLKVRGIINRGELIGKQSYEHLSMIDGWIQLVEPSRRIGFEKTTTRVLA